ETGHELAAPQLERGDEPAASMLEGVQRPGVDALPDAAGVNPKSLGGLGDGEGVRDDPRVGYSQPGHWAELARLERRERGAEFPERGPLTLTEVVGRIDVDECQRPGAIHEVDKSGGEVVLIDAEPALEHLV